MIGSNHLRTAVLACTLGLPWATAHAQTEEDDPGSGDEYAREAEERAAKQRRLSRLHDPRGSLLVGVSGGASFSSGFNYGVLGAHVGYAVLTGVVPGVRGALFFGDLTGGETAAMVWLTPPLALPVVPFAVGEIGYAWQNYPNADFNGALFGAGAGLHLGEPQARFNARAGVIYRFYDFGGGFDYWSPIVMLSFRF